MKLVYHPEARADLEKAAKYFAEIDYLLADDFKNRVAGAIETILKQPRRYRLIEADIRRCNVSRFPYAIYFRLINETIQILVIKHHRRRPDLGFNRAKD